VISKCEPTVSEPSHLNQLISESLDMDTALHEISQAAASLIDCLLVRIWIADEASQTLTLPAGSSGDPRADARSTSWPSVRAQQAGWPYTDNLSIFPTS
jgi:hypothetical protein